MHRRTTLLGAAAATIVLAATASPARAANGVVHIYAKNTGYNTELWYHQDGSGWRMRMTGITGTTSWVANRKGIRITIAKGSRGGPAGTDFISHDELMHPRKDDFPDAPSLADYLTNPWTGLPPEPMEEVKRGELRIAGETTWNGEPAYDLVDPGPNGVGHYYAAKDDGALLATRGLAGGYDVQTYEVIAATSAKKR